MDLVWVMFFSKSSIIIFAIKIKHTCAELSFTVRFMITVKSVLNGHSKRRPKIGFQDRLSLNAGQKYFIFDIH